MVGGIDEALVYTSPLWVLSLGTLNRLSSYLNERKYLHAENGRLRDWRGLIHVAGLSFEEELQVKNSQDKTKEAIMIWCKKKAVHMGNLIKALEELDRYDVRDDLYSAIAEDCKLAKAKLDDPNVDVDLLTTSRALTIQDVAAVKNGGQLIEYHALVLYGDDGEDVAFAEEVIGRMEAVGLRVFVPSRDLKAGTIENAAMAEIICDRCRKVVPIFSPSFLRSRDNLFLTELAQYVGIETNQSKILPVILKACNLPANVKIYHKIKYDPDSRLVNFWDKLLRQPFGIDNVPEHLRSMDFRLAEERFDLPIGATNINAGLSSSSWTTTASFDTESLATSISTNFTTVDSEAPLLLPEPPTHEPGGSKTRKNDNAVVKRLKKFTRKLAGQQPQQ